MSHIPTVVALLTPFAMAVLGQATPITIDVSPGNTPTVIESGRGKEYSYPCLTEGRDGRIHLSYTWERKRIRHVEFNLAWLGDGSPAREAVAQ